LLVSSESLDYGHVDHRAAEYFFLDGLARYQTEILTARLPMLCYADFQRQGRPIGTP